MKSAYKEKEIFRHLNLPGSEKGHEEHLDENDGGVEGKRLKELLVNIQTHIFELFLWSLKMIVQKLKIKYRFKENLKQNTGSPNREQHKR